MKGRFKKKKKKGGERIEEELDLTGKSEYKQIDWTTALLDTVRKGKVRLRDKSQIKR